jgi:exodeoxyribonuclease VII small subunit
MVQQPVIVPGESICLNNNDIADSRCKTRSQSGTDLSIFFDYSCRKDWTPRQISCITIYRRSETPLAKFEECLQRLEKIVRELENGEVPLENSLALFEEGMQLSSSCRKELEQAEGKVEMLLKKNGKLQAEPFEPLTEKAPARR